MSIQEMLALVIILVSIDTIITLVIIGEIGHGAVLQSKFIPIAGHLAIN